jgi:hypothetical protein
MFSLSSKDSTKKHFSIPSTFTYTNDLSASYVNYKNWKYSGINNFAFLVRSNINYDTLGNNWETHIRFNAELGYMKFVDSVWYKNNDFLDLNVEVVKTKTKKITNVFSFYCNSQFLSNYENFYDEHGEYAKRWSGGFGNPMVIDIAYGSELRFWKNCRMNLTFVTLRTTVSPAMEDQQNTYNDFIYKRSIITSEYGIGIQTFIRHKFGERIRWENYSRGFANAINRDRFNVDFRNRIILKVFKCLDLILDSRVRYTPIIPYKFQFRNELMLSFTFEKI